MNIGQASRASGVSTKMIRYYENVGLIRPAARTQSNYRDFGERELNELQFVKRARTFGFSVEEISRLLELWRNQGRPSRDVKAIAQRHVEELEARIAEMQAMVETLAHLADSCAGDERPDCPILANLGGVASDPAARQSSPAISCVGRTPSSSRSDPSTRSRSVRAAG